MDGGHRLSPEPLAGLEYFMREALAEAELARVAGEVPVGCVLVHGSEIIGRGHNRRQRDQDPTAHAEMIAIRQAAARLGSWRLIDVVAFVTLEPCPMCAGALVNSRVDTLVYGCTDPKAGAVDTLFQLGSDSRLNHRFKVIGGVLSEACSAILSEFFGQIRASRG
jgi:tRNA(adenine34) deaminase